MEKRFSKYYAIAMITDPTAVKAKAAMSKSDNGAIFVSCPELGFSGPNLLYCRYGLSIPYLRVQMGQSVWIEPTVGDTERWIYTGFADAGGEFPMTMDQMIIKNLVSAIKMTTDGKIVLGFNTGIPQIELSAEGIVLKYGLTNSVQLSASGIVLKDGTSEIDVSALSGVTIKSGATSKLDITPTEVSSTTITGITKINTHVHASPGAPPTPGT